MRCEPTDICYGHANRRVLADERSVPRGAGSSAAYKRPSTLVPVVPVSTTSAYPCRGSCSLPGALIDMTGVGSLP